jgi:hypothetical protein
MVLDELLVESNRAEYDSTCIGTNTGSGGTGHLARISDFELWRIGGDGLVASTQGQFRASEYHRQLQHSVMEPRRCKSLF